MREQRNTICFFKNFGDSGAVAFADVWRGGENRKPDTFALDFGVAVSDERFGCDGGRGNQGLRNYVVGLAQKFKERDQSVEAKRENFGGGEAIGAEGEFAQGSVVPVEGREE